MHASHERGRPILYTEQEQRIPFFFQYETLPAKKEVVVQFRRERTVEWNQLCKGRPRRRQIESGELTPIFHLKMHVQLSKKTGDRVSLAALKI